MHPRLKRLDELLLSGAAEYSFVDASSDGKRYRIRVSAHPDGGFWASATAAGKAMRSGRETKPSTAFEKLAVSIRVAERHADNLAFQKTVAELRARG